MTTHELAKVLLGLEDKPVYVYGDSLGPELARFVEATHPLKYAGLGDREEHGEGFVIAAYPEDTDAE